MGSIKLDSRIYVSLLLLFIYVIFASLFHVERTFADGAAEIMDVTNRNKSWPFTLHPALGIKSISQLPLYLIDQFGGSPSYYSIFYSLGFLLPYLITFLICCLIYRNQNLALMTIMVLFVDQTTNFFFIASLAPAFPYFILAYAILSNASSTNSNSILEWLVLTYLCLVTAISHPTGFVLMFILVSSFFLRPEGFKRRILYYCTTLCCVSIVVYFQLLMNDYSKSAVSNVSLLPENPFKLYAHMASLYTISFLLFIGSLAFSLYKKNFDLHVIYLASCAVGFVLYVNLGVKIEARSEIYVNYAYSALVLIFLFVFMESLKDVDKRVISSLGLLACLPQIYYIIYSSDFFIERIEYIERATANCALIGERKCFIDPKSVPPYANFMTQHFRAESLVVSSRFRGLPIVTVSPIETRVVPPRWLSNLDQEFSDYPDYYRLNSSSDNPMPNALELIDIRVLDPEIRLPRNENELVDILIENRTHEVLASISYANRPIKISYHIFDDRDVVVWDGVRTPLEFDVPAGGKLRQSVLVTAPSAPGKYTIEFDIVVEGQAWLRRGAKAEITVR